MGTCLSKKKSSSSSFAVNGGFTLNHGVSSSVPQPQAAVVEAEPEAVAAIVEPNKPKMEKQQQQQQQQHQQKEDSIEEEEVNQTQTQIQIQTQTQTQTQLKKEIFIIKHRRSHEDRDRKSKNQDPPLALAGAVEDDEAATATATATANAASVQLGVRTSSCTKEEVDAILIQCGRLSRSSSGKAASSSSSRKYSGSKRSYDLDDGGIPISVDVDDTNCDGDDERRLRNRQRHRQSSRTRASPSPSPQGRRRRTPSRERDQQQQRSTSRERRVSRSPGRREATCSVSTNCRAPGKMVSVPATVSSLVMDKSNNGDSVKRISVKRNAGNASPRSHSPARLNVNAKPSSNDCQPMPSLSRNSSRKAEQSPYRRNPLSEIDPNNNRVQNKCTRETDGDDIIIKEPSNVSNQVQAQKTNYKSSARVTADKKIISSANAATAKEQNAMVETTVVMTSGAETHTLTRSRSARRSRDLDLDINPETLLNPNSATPSYTRLLLEDIQNFHQKSTPTTVVSLPPCVTNACSILEAVADLNSTTSSNLSCALSEDQIINSLLGPTPKSKDPPFVESEVVIGSFDDLTEPSFHKYVTVRRGGGDALEDQEQESSGSNSFVGGGSQQHWGLSSSSWEPNSADSTDCWTSRSNATPREDERFSGRMKRDSCNAQPQPQRSSGIGRGRLGTATAAAAAKGPS